MAMTSKPARLRKPGAGRKAKGASPYEKQINLRISAETDSSLRAWARVESEETGKTVDRTDIARDAIENALRDKQFI